MAVTTDIHPSLAQRGKLIKTSTSDIGYTVRTNQYPGFRKSTAAEISINIPLEKLGNEMVFQLLMTPASSGHYPQIDVHFAPVSQGEQRSAAWAGRNITFGSTSSQAWCSFISTAEIGATSSESASYLFGPIDTGQFGLYFGTTSSGIINAGQYFVRIMAGYSTAAAACTHAKLSTCAETIQVAAIEIPQ